MSRDPPQYGNSVRSLLSAIDEDRKVLINLGRSLMGKSGDPFFPVDLLALGALKRSAVLKGDRIDRMKGRDGKKLTDAHLVATHSGEHPWLPEVYACLSGYVHFSGSHIFDSVRNLEDDGRIQFAVTAEDLNFPEASWIEVLECFREATEILMTYLEGYRVTKSMSPEEMEAGRPKG